MEESYIENIKASGGIASEYGVMADPNCKVGVLWSARAGCTVTVHAFLDLLGLRSDAMEYSGPSIIHKYRTELYDPHAEYVPIKQLHRKRYRFIKVIVNPFRRAVSIWHMTFPSRVDDLSFREWARQMAQGAGDVPPIQGMCEDDIFHSRPQYSSVCEKFVSEYLRLDRDESVFINGFEFRPAKFSSHHHSRKIDSQEFAGDIRKSQIKSRMPRNYRHFYDDEIRANIETAYRDDVEHYGYTLEDLC